MRPVACLAACAAFLLVAPAVAEQSTALWHVVHDLCVVDQRMTGLPAPCTAVDRARGVAIVKDFGGPTGYLLVPTRRVTGIEDPVLRAPGTVNYWAKAWHARRYMMRKAGGAVDRADIGLAVNAIAGRTQAQLHIHIDCVQPAVKAALAAARDQIDAQWRPLTLLGRPYRVRLLADGALAEQDPFKILADSDPAAAAAMGRQTLALVGIHAGDGAPAFALVTAPVSATFAGHGEELLDHRCAVLGRPARPG